jgi:hypothetical protein
LLVYNLATLAGSDPDKFESELFSNTLVAYINAFVIVFMYWSLLSVILDITLYLDAILIISDSFDNSDTSPGSEYITSTKLKSRSSSVCSLYSYCSGIIINSRGEIQKG